MSLSGKITGILLLTLVVHLAKCFRLACLDIWCVEKLSPNSLETQSLETAKNSSLRKKNVKWKELIGEI